MSIVAQSVLYCLYVSNALLVYVHSLYVSHYVLYSISIFTVPHQYIHRTYQYV